MKARRCFRELFKEPEVNVRVTELKVRSEQNVETVAQSAYLLEMSDPIPGIAAKDYQTDSTQLPDATRSCRVSCY